MYIEAVITCVNYSDFLAHTLPHNMEMVERLVVVTHPNDRATKALCDKYCIDCIPTEIMHDDGDKFNKGRLINLGLSNLRHDGWLLHLDADVLLPHNFRHCLKMAKLDKTCIYGADRLNTKTYENWEKNKHKTIPQHQYRFMVTPQSEFSIGSRLLHLEYGYVPIGYFQLWHSCVRRTYPIVCGSAEHSDVLFGIQWPVEKRILLPTCFVFHLESEPAKMGTNWDGRQTSPFGPPGTKIEICKTSGHKGIRHPLDDSTPKY